MKKISRWKYIQKMIYKKFDIVMSDEYSFKLQRFLLDKCEAYDKNIGYCGRGNTKTNKSLAQRLVPDFKSKNKSCFIHDNLYNAIKYDLITKELADDIFYCSMLYEAGYNPFKRLDSYLYYIAVKDFVKEIE